MVVFLSCINKKEKEDHVIEDVIYWVIIYK